MMELGYEKLTAAEYGRMVNEGKIDPEVGIEYFISRIERLNPKINAFTYTRFEYARAEAKRLKQRLSQGENVGPFAGVPFALKDFLPSKKGWTASHGGVASRITIDVEDSEFCKAMEKLGGIAIGKTNAPAYGFSGTCDNKLYGATHNPFDLSRNSGGSSGGSASAVASGMVLIAEGGDAGGSIRIPACWNNLFGMKPSAGLIPSVIRPDSYSATHPYCCNGGLTKSVEDSAILVNEMVKYEPRDPTSVPLTKVDYLQASKGNLREIRIGYTPDFGLFPVEKEVVQKMNEVLEVLAQSGASVEELKFKFPRSAQEYMDMWCLSLSFDSVIEFDQLKEQGFDFLKDHRDEVSPIFVEWVKKASNVSKKEIYEFNLMRTEILDAFEDAFEKYDLILSPTALCLAPKNSPTKGLTSGPSEINGQPIDANLGFATTFLVNFIGYPAASIPAGLSANGLPVGIHAIAPKYRDERIYTLAKTIEDKLPWASYYQISYAV